MSPCFCSHIETETNKSKVKWCLTNGRNSTAFERFRGTRDSSWEKRTTGDRHDHAQREPMILCAHLASDYSRSYSNGLREYSRAPTRLNSTARKKLWSFPFSDLKHRLQMWMCQKTKVAVGIEHCSTWIERFPTKKKKKDGLESTSCQLQLTSTNQ